MHVCQFENIKLIQTGINIYQYSVQDEFKAALTSIYWSLGSVWMALIGIYMSQKTAPFMKTGFMFKNDKFVQWDIVLGLILTVHDVSHTLL